MDIKIQQDCKHVLVMIVYGRYFYGHDVVLVFRILNCFFISAVCHTPAWVIQQMNNQFTTNCWSIDLSTDKLVSG